MKYKAIYWLLPKPFIKKYLRKIFGRKKVKTIFKNAKKEYKLLLAKADDIGENNPMAGNLYFSLLFLSFLTGNEDCMTKEMLVDMMKSVLEDPLLNFFQRFDFNNEKDMEKLKKRIVDSSEWAEKHRDKYLETWEFNFDDSRQDGCYYYFTKCPIAKFFKDNNLEHLTHIFCELDYITIKAKHGNLFRDYTLANGDEMCDFWIVGDKVKDPK